MVPGRSMQWTATLGLIVALALAYVLAWGGLDSAILQLIAFVPSLAGAQPWSFVTYPFFSWGLGSDALWQILLLVWLWWVGNDIERENGPKALLLAFFAFALLGSLAVYIGSFVTPAGGIWGPGLPVSALTVAWCARNPSQQIRIWGILPVTGLILAAVTAVVTVFGIGARPNTPVIGLFALAPLAAAWFWGSSRFRFAPYGRSAVKLSGAEARRKKAEVEKYLDDVRKREKDREERERLRKLFESSLEDDDQGRR